MTNPLVEPVIDWFDEVWRPLPWRSDDVSPWGIFVSEMMSHQTPVARVAPIWLEWMHRWPTPTALANASIADVLRAWGRLGYPRRALRLQEAAAMMVAEFGGEVPNDHDQLLRLPGVGPYTAAAVASFAFGERVAVVDVNIRRVIARAVSAHALPAPALSKAEQALAQALLPADATTARQWNAAVMELGALVCTARTPLCEQCPIADQCAWVAAGRPEHVGPKPRVQAWHGTDRQVRGRIVGLIREAGESCEIRGLDGVSDEQFRRCVASLIVDGLIIEVDGQYDFPGA